MAFRTPALRRALLRPSVVSGRPSHALLAIQRQQTRLNSSNDPGSKLRHATKEPIEKGTTKEYGHDGSGMNQNLIYIGVAGIGIGAAYWMFMAKPDTVAGKSDSHNAKNADQYAKKT